MTVHHLPRVDAGDVQGCKKGFHSGIQLGLANVPEFNRKVAAMKTKHIDAHPGIREVVDATAADHNSPARKPFGGIAPYRSNKSFRLVRSIQRGHVMLIELALRLGEPYRERA